MRLEGKVAVITGGARGLGAAMAELFAKEGARVVAVDLGDATYENPNIELYKLNITDSVACKEFYDYAIEKYGHVDILVNNAGITKDAMTRKMTDDMFDAVIAVNLKGVFNLTRYFGPKMEENNYGSIINISSVVGVFGNIGQANYSASKAGMIGFTQTLAKEFGSRNIRVNAVCPGFIQTAMTAELPNIDEYLKAIPMKRLGTPEDIAKVVKFLALDTDYVTGQAIEVAGGLML